MPPIKHTFKLIYKQEIIPKVFLLTYQTDLINDFLPGHCFSHQIAGDDGQSTYRPYSVLHIDTNLPVFLQDKIEYTPEADKMLVSFLISTKPGGVASTFFEKIQVGSQLQALGPVGSFRLVENDNPKVFIATGTGVAPFVEMINKQMEIEPKTKITVFFGVWVKADNFAPMVFNKYLANKEKYPNFNLITVVDDFKPEDLDTTTFGGRVTTVVPDNIENYLNTDFYICGHPLMVADMQKVLEDNGCKLGVNLFMEKFGQAPTPNL